ncbi:methyltransferase domain-containing protein [Mesorhizobium sp. M0199]|uniref:class I SAM-dependent methyltransferase n=1 Tax=unclassified Mesorhizobium TaxID=325217 RepID=UPI003336944C
MSSKPVTWYRSFVKRKIVMSAKGVEEARPITVTDTAADIYSDSQYLANNPDWHLADTAWKAREIANILERNNVVWRDAVEVGCGSGGIVGKLAAKYPGRPIHGYDISEDAAKLWPLQKASGAIFHHEDFLATKSVHDLVMLIDVFEHVEDYMGFLRALRPHGRYHVFHIPLDLHVQGLVRRAYMHARQKVGHLHYFTRETALATLEDTGYTVVDWHFTDVAGEANVSTRPLRTKLLNPVRKLIGSVAPATSALLLGGFSLMVL